MESLPYELILTIFSYIQKITDKRQYLKTCKTYNNITKNVIKKFELEFNIKNFKKIIGYCVEKFTLELCHDSYFNLIPMSYINPNNKILAKALAMYNNTELLDIAYNNNCMLPNKICNWAAKAGNEKVVKWWFLHDDICLENNTKDKRISSITGESYINISFRNKNWNESYLNSAIKYGQLNILIWGKENRKNMAKGALITCAKRHKKDDIVEWINNNL